jgi:hypothetical protein
MTTSTTWLQRKLDEPCACYSGYRYRSCCLRREAAYFIIGALAALALFGTHDLGLIVAIPIFVLVGVMGWLVSRHYQRAHTDEKKPSADRRFLPILPATKEKWFELLLLPFKVFILFEPLWLQAWKFEMRGFPFFRSLFHEERHYFGNEYLLCLNVFVLAALCQSVLRKRRAALMSLFFAAVTFAIYFFYLCPINESK